MNARELIDVYISFFEKKDHKQIPNSPLVPIDDPTTLFTSSGMQPLVPYLLGQRHPAGNRLVDVQNCFRAVDIDEVGDNRHTTFFRMLGNWSLGDYFKNEQIPWVWEFLTDELGLPEEKLYITVFKGTEGVEKDNESYEIWKKLGIEEEKIFFGDVSKNWWSRSGAPQNMPVGEIGGPDTEVYYRFGDDQIKHKQVCKDNPVDCECGKFLEIANSVFIQYQKQKDGHFLELPQQNVDFGGGLERLLAAVENKSDIFKTSLFAEIIEKIEKSSDKKYFEVENQPAMRIIADHLKASTFLIINGVLPSNKDRGYVLRRLLRRAAVKMHQLGGGLTPGSLATICDEVLRVEESVSSSVDRHKNRELVMQTVDEEMDRFATSLDRGLKILENYDDSQLNALNAFNLFQSYGFPLEISDELFKQRGKTIDKDEFDRVLEAHKELSRTASAGMFRGGLADTSEQTIMGHTATHLLHQALRDVFGSDLHQTGSNITAERIRFDFNHDERLTDEEIKKVESIVNGKIAENLPVHFEMLPLEKAKEIEAIGLFDDKYQDKVKVYFIGDYSKEFCGGPHVDFTGKLNRFKIIKQENLGKEQKRLYAKVG